MKHFFLILFLGCPFLGLTQSVPDTLAPSQTRLSLAQATPPEAAAVSSQAVATQPSSPKPARLSVSKSSTNQTVPPTASVPRPKILDPLLDLNRPKNCQLESPEDQTIRCGTVEVFLPAGTYQQVKIVEGPQERTAAASADLKSQAQGLGYIRYLSEVKIKVNGEERSGGLDIGVRPSDQLPLRIWYKKFNPPDDATKALGFIFPPIMITAGLGASASGNTLIPDTNPKFTEARDYYIEETKAHTGRGSAEQDLYNIKPAEAAAAGSFSTPNSPPSALRSR